MEPITRTTATVHCLPFNAPDQYFTTNFTPATVAAEGFVPTRCEDLLHWPRFQSLSLSDRLDLRSETTGGAVNLRAAQNKRLGFQLMFECANVMIMTITFISISNQVWAMHVLISARAHLFCKRFCRCRYSNSNKHENKKIRVLIGADESWPAQPSSSFTGAIALLQIILPLMLMPLLLLCLNGALI